MADRIGPAKVMIHAVQVHDKKGKLLRTHLQKGGKYWPKGDAGRVVVPSGRSRHFRHLVDKDGVIHHG